MKSFKRIISCFLTLIILTTFFSIPSAQAVSTKENSTIEISATCYYSDAFEVLNLVNKIRKSKGLNELKMDSKMLEDAMQRAAETAVNFDHTRPDGSSCFDINDDIYAENIAISYVDPSAAVQGWVDSPAHYANLTSKSYKSTGIGAVIHNGKRYWVQVFGSTVQNTTTTVPDDKDKDFNIYLGKKTYDISMTLPKKLFLTDKESIQITGKNAAYSTYFVINPDTFSFSSSNSKVVSMTGNVASALSIGTATITAKNSAATITSTVEVTEFGGDSNSKCGDNISWDYNNGVLTLTGSGRMYDYNTVYDDSGAVSTNVPWKDILDSVEKVIVSQGITYIGNCAFSCFGELKEVELPSTLTEIGEKAFAYCKKLSDISLPDSITAIKSESFYKCEALTYVKLPSNLKTVSSKLFYSCSSLTNVDIPGSVETIELSAFAYCYVLSNVTLPESLKVIDGYAFISCKALTEITIPYNVSSVNKKAFSGCTNLSKVTFLDPTTIISTDNTFTDTSAKLKIYGYNNSSAQKYCADNSISFIALSSTKLSFKAYGYSTVYTSNPVTDDITIDVENAPKEYSVRFSKGSTFDFNASFDSVEKLGEYWRENAPYNDQIKDYLISCGTYPISYCVYSKGSEPNFGSANIVINKATPAFGFESKSVEIPWYIGGDNSAGFMNSLNKIDDLSVLDIEFVSDDTSVLITDFKGNIYAKRYGECTVTASYKGDNNHNPHSASFTAKVYPVGELTIGDFIFIFSEDKTVNIKRYFGLDTDIDIPSNILSQKIHTINEKAFHSAGLSEVIIPDGIKLIGKNAFTSGYRLESVTLSSTVDTIEEEAFSNCKVLTNVTIPMGVKTIKSNAFLNCLSLKSVTIPASVTTVSDYAFGYKLDDDSQPQKIEDFIIYGYKDTAAEEYANINGFEFVELEQPQYVKGDVDYDNVLSVIDATAIQRHVAELFLLTQHQIILGDFTGDGSVDIMDATAIQMTLIGLL